MLQIVVTLFVIAVASIAKSPAEVERLIETINHKTPLGIQTLETEGLTPNLTGLLPKSILPDAYTFNISNSEDSDTASYLVDGRDYAEEAEIGLPLSSQERLELLFELVDRFIGDQDVKNFYLALMDHDHVEDLKVLRPSNYREFISQDVHKYYSPERVYQIKGPEM